MFHLLLSLLYLTESTLDIPESSMLNSYGQILTFPIIKYIFDTRDFHTKNESDFGSKYLVVIKL